jgi:hypothetical protein
MESHDGTKIDAAEHQFAGTYVRYCLDQAAHASRAPQGEVVTSVAAFEKD